MYIQVDQEFHTSNLFRTSLDRATSWNTPKSPVLYIAQENSLVTGDSIMTGHENRCLNAAL